VDPWPVSDTQYVLKIQCQCGCGTTTWLEGEFPFILGDPELYCSYTITNHDGEITYRDC